MPFDEEVTREERSPVTRDEKDDPIPGVALCLSGGGYRAMLFHVGTLWRINELGYLGKLDRISSVSGGSITAGVLGMNWSRLAFDGEGRALNLRAQLVEPLRSLASRTIDQSVLLSGVLTPGTVAEKVAQAFRDHLFGGTELSDLPERPRLVINATNVQTGTLWRFSRAYMADYQVGVIKAPKVALADAVAASSAFPPMLSPFRLKVDPSSFEPDSRGALCRPPFNSRIVLTDGGAYDNLGLETAWKRYTTILVSDGGGHMAPEPDPKADWVRHSIRLNSIIDNQVRSLRKRQVVAAYLRGDRTGAYWSIRSEMSGFAPLDSALPCPEASTRRLAETPTRLKAIDGLLQQRIINWGYAICDAGMRRWVVPAAPAPADFPYPEAGVG